jgi:Ca-activated chloride channel family protein
MDHPLLRNLFARPALLGCAAAAVVLAALFLFARYRRRRALAALGGLPGLRRQLQLRPGVRAWRGVCLLAGVLLLAVACAGPQWGRDYGESRAAADDLVVVLDLSRSMNAEQPSRRERAVRLLRDLADALERRGGRRVALVVFAARPMLLFPLTQDYDHFRDRLKQVAGDDLPPLNPEPDAPFRSGTRIGAALRLALEALDPARAARQAILLVSDGDDPEAADEEWLEGALAARARGVRVITAGVGDPDRPRTIPDDGDVLRFQGEVVHTRLNETLLQEIARRTGGAYLPAHTHALPLGTLVLNLLEQPAEPTGPDDDGLPVYQQQYAWFLGPALLLLLLSLLLNEGPSPRSAVPRPALAAGLAVLLVGTAALPDAEPLVRDGNAAFAATDYDAAVGFYDQAGRSTADPGLVAFNRAAALYRLGRFAEAVACYRQCLEDDLAPAPRRARAHYDLGTALLKQSGATSPSLLRKAVQAFRACLAQPGLDPDLSADARHNLELAQLLWLKARAENPEQSADGGGDQRPETKQPKAEPGGPNKDKQAGPNGAMSDKEPGGKDGNGPAGEGKKDALKAGPLDVLPDTDQVVPLPPAQADEQLDQVIERILRERRAHLKGSDRTPKDARNW